MIAASSCRVARRCPRGWRRDPPHGKLAPMLHRFLHPSCVSAFMLSALLIALTVAGCGRRGPLYLPDELKKPPEQAPASSP